jgi:hypothetical protein
VVFNLPAPLVYGNGWSRIFVAVACVGRHTARNDKWSFAITFPASSKKANLKTQFLVKEIMKYSTPT